MNATDLDTRLPISVVVMTRNEEANLPACLDSVRLFCEVFVVDSESTDMTRQIADAAGAAVVEFKWDGGYPKKKQWCLENLPFAFDWVLYLDADERVSNTLVEELRQLFSAGEPKCAGYFIGLDYVFLGRTLRHGHRVYKLALLRRAHARFVDRDDLAATNMWEVEGHYQPTIDGRVGTLAARLEHRDHSTLFYYFERHNKYSDWEAFLQVKRALSHPEEAQPTHRALLKRVFARLPLRGALFFLYSYFLKLGFLDGRAGFNHSVAKAFYYWQVGLKRTEIQERDVGHG